MPVSPVRVQAGTVTKDSRAGSGNPRLAMFDRRGARMDADELHRPLYVPDLLVNALGQTPERPLMHLMDGPTLTVGEVRDATSQFVQALHSLGVAAGSRVSLLSPNRPEVLHVSHALQL